MHTTLITTVAQAYGTGLYGDRPYTCTDQSTAAECATLTSPNTGTAAQPSVFLLPGVILLAIVLYVGTLIVLKKRRATKK